MDSWPEPSGFIIQTDSGGVQPSYAILVPSGDQLGARSSAGENVSCVRFEPSAFIMNNAWSPAGARPENTIFCPSGDQLGCRSRMPSVNCVTPVPSAFAFQIP